MNQNTVQDEISLFDTFLIPSLESVNNFFGVDKQKVQITMIHTMTADILVLSTPVTFQKKMERAQKILLHGITTI